MHFRHGMHDRKNIFLIQGTEFRHVRHDGPAFLPSIAQHKQFSFKSRTKLIHRVKRTNFTRECTFGMDCTTKAIFLQEVNEFRHVRPKEPFTPRTESQSSHLNPEAS